ncbi:MAG TPA: DMT family transporter [Mycobacteriales bacterium]|nr:DMT family transporter [Mycobacteriales bacterium]
MSRRGWILFATMGIVWGIPYLLIKVAVEHVSVPMLVFTRTAVGAVLLLPLAIYRGELRALRPYWRPLVLFAAVEIIGPWWLLSSAEQKLSSSMSGLLIAAVPIIGAILALVTGHADRLTPARWCGLILGLGGVGLLVGPGAHGASAWSVVEVMLTALGYAIGPQIADRALAGAPRLGMTAVCLAFAAVVYTPSTVLSLPHSVPPARVIAAMLGLAVICTAAAFLLFFALIAEVGPARATVITYVNPAVAVALGVAVLNEPFTVAIGVSFVLILTGSVLATSSRLSRRRPVVPPVGLEPTL